MTGGARRVDRELIFLLGCTLVTLLSWVGFEVYRAYTKSELPQGIEKYLQELDPTLNLSVLNKLEMHTP